MTTTATPMTASSAILIATRDSGGVARFWRRLATARSHWLVPAATTTTARTIQPTRGVMFPWTML